MEKLFDTTKYLDEYSKTTKMMFGFVYPSEVKNLLEKTVDLQVEAAKVAGKLLEDSVS